MKKTIYQKPYTIVIEVKTQRPIASSIQNVTLSTSLTIDSDGDFGSRSSNSIWDDEDEY